MVGVDPECRGKRVGRTLLTEALKYLGENGFVKVSLSVLRGNHAIGLYESLGFRQVRESDGSIEMVAEIPQ
jgi:ribosomal protein S18 acetylase RimI-like enzyme